MPESTSFEALFSRLIPDSLSDGVLYISMDYGTVIHLCACGCGEKVITPLSPTDWQLLYDGEGVTLKPSIGNYNFPCRSHYWIRNSRVVWAPTLEAPIDDPLETKEVQVVPVQMRHRGLGNLLGLFGAMWDRIVGWFARRN